MTEKELENLENLIDYKIDRALARISEWENRDEDALDNLRKELSNK